MPLPREAWEEVLERFGRGEPDAVARVSDVIVGYLHRYRAYDRRTSWDDLCQDVLISLLGTVRKGTLREPGAFVNYVGIVVRNRLANFAQRSDRRDRDLELDEERIDTQSVDAPKSRTEPASDRADLAIDLGRGLEQLDPRCRSVVEHIYLHGYSYQETADRLSISLPAVKRDQIKGLKALREVLGIPA
ncbi:MAG: sigma-70 family RNA polymerase sigma factor [Myxococcota bacterium]|nr:sigma-70 family RNA polymerase sigma factor [Myxococcota bacterium]